MHSRTIIATTAAALLTFGAVACETAPEDDPGVPPPADEEPVPQPHEDQPPEPLPEDDDELIGD